MEVEIGSDSIQFDLIIGLSKNIPINSAALISKE